MSELTFVGPCVQADEKKAEEQKAKFDSENATLTADLEGVYVS